MADGRNTRGGPGGIRRPARRVAQRSRPVAQPAGAAPGAAPRRSRLTGRAAILVLVLAVLTVSYASSMRAYVQQRAHITELKTLIAQREVSIDDLEREKRRWDDPAYVQQQARERFGYVMPGETSYVVLGADGKPLESRGTLTDPETVLARTPTPWWDNAWKSVELAGLPPATEPPPLTRIDGSRE